MRFNSYTRRRSGNSTITISENIVLIACDLFNPLLSIHIFR